jgi:hypothetical protein
MRARAMQLNNVHCTMYIRDSYVQRAGVQIMGGVWSFPQPQWRHRAWWWQVHARA